MMSENKKNITSKRDILFFLIFLLLFLFMFKDFFFTSSVFYERDSTLIEIPTRMLCVKLLKEGNFALWTDSYGNGQPYLANPKNAVLYPSTLLYLFLPFFIAFKIHYFIHILICWVGLYYLCKSYSLSKRASFFGATIFIFSGIFLSSIEFYNHVAALCWMPWILLILNRYKKEFFPKLFILSFLWALLILAGTPYVILMTFIFGLVQTFLSQGRIKKRIMLIAFSLLIALFISSVQLIPSLELVKNSDRTVTDTTQWSLEIIQLSNLFFPNILGNDREPGHNDFWGDYLFDKGYPLYYSLYLGFGVFILFFLGFRKPFEKIHIIFLATFFIFFLLSLGKYSPFFFLFKIIPPFSAIRYPVKYLTGVVFSLSIISAIGFDNVFILRKSKKKQIFLFFSFSLLLFFLYVIFKNQFLSLLTRFFVIDSKQSILELGNSLIHGFLIFILCAFIIFLSSVFYSFTKFFNWILLFIIVIDLVIANRFINPVVPISFFNRPDILKEIKTPLKIYRDDYLPLYLKKEIASSFHVHNYLRQSFYPFCLLGNDIEYLFNKDFYGLYSKEYHIVRNYLKNCQKEELVKILTLSGCNYYIGHYPLPNLSTQIKDVEGYSIYLQKIKNPLKFPYLVFDSIKAKSTEEKIKILVSEDFNPKKIAIVEIEINLKENFSNEKNYEIVTLEETQGRKKYLIKTSHQAIAVFSGGYHPGWNAWINGKKTKVFKVNLISKGILIPPGKHEVILKYFPLSFFYGLNISIFSFVGIALAFLFYRKRGYL